MKHGRRDSAWDVASAGTYADARLPRPVMAVVLVVALIAVAIPSVGMLWARTDSTTENRELSPAPALVEEDGSFNVGFLADAGAYLDDHFAYRNALVTANARIRAALGVSATDQVVVGTDEWLYYGGTLPDYLGQSALGDRALRNIAHNLALAQSYAKSQGAAFTFALAPNKSSLYPQNMPYYYVKSPDAGNAQRLMPLLDEAGVNHVDLASLFADRDRVRYLKGDSHWDNRGALEASQALLASLGHDRLDVSADDAVSRRDFSGDLYSMLYPAGDGKDVNWYFEGVNDGPGMSGSRWSYAEGGDVTDGWVRTESQAGEGSLLMFRDSFGNALLPLWASAYRSAAFSKLVPYNLPAMSQVKADAVVVERAERHLSYLATNPPIMPNPRVSLRGEIPQSDDGRGGATTLSVSTDGPYWLVEGTADEGALAVDSPIYVSVEAPGADPVVFDASWKSSTSDYGYQVYVPSEPIDLEGAVKRVLTVEGGKVVCLKTFR